MSTTCARLFIKEGEKLIPLDLKTLTNTQVADLTYFFQKEHDRRLSKRKSGVKPIQEHVKEALLITGQYEIAGLGVIFFAPSGRRSKNGEQVKLRFRRHGRGLEARKLRAARQQHMQAGLNDNAHQNTEALPKD